MLTRLTLLLCALSAGAVAACTARAAPDTTLSSCYSGADATSTAVLYAADNGFFPRNGLKVNMIEGKTATVTPALASGSADIGVAAVWTDADLPDVRCKRRLCRAGR